MKEKFDPKGSFIVKNLNVLNVVLGVILLLVAILLLLSAIFNFLTIAILIGLIGGGINAMNMKNKGKIVFQINTNGIYYLNKLVTNFENYKCSYFKREMSDSNSLAEKTILYIQYYKENETGYFLKKIKLGNEDKDESDIVEAIEFYFNEYQKKASLH